MNAARTNHNLVCLIGFLIAFTAIPHNSRAEWDTYQADASHNGYVPGNLSTANPKVLWTTTLPQGGLTGLTVGGGYVYGSSNLYFGSATIPNVYALNALTGSIAWSQSTGSNFSVNPPAYSNGSVYVQTDEENTGTYVWSFNATTGTMQFKTPLDAQWEDYLAPTVFNGNLYMDGGHYGGMYSVSASTGTQNWFGSVPQYDGWTPAVTSNYCYTFTGSGDTTPIYGKFTILNRTTGTTVSVTTDTGFSWNGYTMDEAPALGNDNDAFVTNGGRILDFGTTSTGGILSVESDHYSGQPSVANGVVYVDDALSVVALSETTESNIWTWTPADGDALDGQIIATDNLLITSTSADVYGISISTGKTVWSVPVSGNLALSDDVLYVSSASNDSVTAIAVPEPASCITFVALAALFIRRRCPTLRVANRRTKCVSH